MGSPCEILIEKGGIQINNLLHLPYKLYEILRTSQEITWKAEVQLYEIVV